jgi:hypothetical protein
MLGLVLLDAKGQSVASWTEHAKAGVTKLTLALPKKARHAGHYTLRVTPSGKGKSKSLPVILRA